MSEHDDTLSTADAALQVRIREHYLREMPSPELGERILRDVHPGGGGRRPVSRRTWITGALAASAAVAAILVAPPVARRIAGDGDDNLATVLVNEMRTFELSGRPLDVAETDPASLQRWFRTRVDFPPPRPPARSGRLMLAGGRLCHIKSRRMVSYMYDDDGSPVSLYILDDTGRPAGPAGDAARHRGYAHAWWRAGDLRYVLVAPVPTGVLDGMARALRLALGA